MPDSRPFTSCHRSTSPASTKTRAPGSSLAISLDSRPTARSSRPPPAAVQSSDAYNWGYDPVHYMTPEGSYAINPNNRVREYRSMVEGIHHAGLRVVQDVVFNHTNAAGEGPNSNLDEVLPNYYHRLDANGNLEEGSCCPDTASEHRMMESS